MKIIMKSNFDLETVDDFIIAENVNKYYGQKIIKLMRDAAREDDKYYPMLVEDDYELYEWQRLVSTTPNRR